MKKQNFLRDYPVDTTPETWPLNDVLLNSVGNKNRFWHRRGYSWRFGQEMEFIPRTMDQFAEISETEIKTPDHLAFISPYAKPSVDLYKRLLGKEGNDDYPKRALGRLIGYVKRAKSIPGFATAAKANPEKMVTELESYRAALGSEDKDTADMARFNAYMAYLHLLPFSKGGLQDVIEPRFGSYRLGRGWWDNSSVAEIRTRLTPSPIDLIQCTHKIIHQAFKAAELFHVVPQFDGVGAHINFSIWRNSDNTNMMRMENEEQLEFCQRALLGIQTMFMEAPNLINDFDPSDILYSVDLRTGNGRGQTIRQKQDCWELRRFYKSNFVHVARDLAIIMGGSAYGVERIKDMDTHKKKYDIDLECEDFAVIRNKFGYRSNALQRLLMETPIDENGQFKKTMVVTRHSIRELLECIGGKDNAELFEHVPKRKRKARDLTIEDTWSALIASISINEDNTLNLEHLDPELKTAFSQFEITGRRKVFKGKNIKTARGMVDLEKKLETLSKSAALKFCVGHRAIERVVSECSALLDNQAEKASSIMARKHVISTQQSIKDEDDEDEKKDIVVTTRETSIIDIYGRLVAPAIENAWDTCITEKDEGWEENQSQALDDVRRGNNLLKLLRPHFKNALHAEIERLQKEEASNYLVSTIHDAADFCDREILTMTSYAYVLMKDSIIGQKGLVSSGVDEAMAGDISRYRMEGDLQLFAQIILHDDLLDTQDVLDDLEKLRQSVSEISSRLKEREFGKPNKKGRKQLNTFLKAAEKGMYKGIEMAEEHIRRIQKNTEVSQQSELQVAEVQ